MAMLILAALALACWAGVLLVPRYSAWRTLADTRTAWKGRRYSRKAT